jgi:patatin-related protein
MVTRDPKPDLDKVEKEVRFAVVMYGGVSLAIYINGVAQELYKMVRATARNQDGDYTIAEPTSTELVYRQLGKLLQARLSVDLLSGTSAGGINAVFLAKALSMNQAFTQLEDVWVNTGDINILINDKQSTVKGVAALEYKQPPTSLLNSRRMYYELLSALDKMDKEKKEASSSSSLVDELDLYVTATDLNGLVVPVQLADGEVHEYRYRTVFHFSHATENADRELSDDFVKDNNPFLAFAARSTSSFPFAFEPIKIEDVSDFLGKQAYTELGLKWNKFYTDYQNQQNDSFDSHSFGDGGYLDNKPFSYITKTLMERRSDTPVDRRLFYIEPAPQKVSVSSPGQSKRPDAIENVAAALVNLPRYETIREDLLQIKDRNDLIQRRNNLLLKIEQARGGTEELKKWLSTGLLWSDQYLDNLIEQYGFGYAAYYELRVADTLDDLALTFSRNLRLQENSDEAQALRQILEEWRKQFYTSNSGHTNGHYSENDLLFRLDLQWRIRRLYFILRSIDDILLGIKTFLPDHPDRQLSGQDGGKLAQELEYQRQAKQVVEKSGSVWEIPDTKTLQNYETALLWIKRYFNKAFAKIREGRHQLQAVGLDQSYKISSEFIPYQDALQNFVNVQPGSFTGILKDRDCLQSAVQAIEAVTMAMSARDDGTKAGSVGYLRQVSTEVAAMCREALADMDYSGAVPQPRFPPPEVPGPVLQSVRACLSFYYNYFDYFDMLTFPITYATPIGESDVVEVYRISPEDANGLFDLEKVNRSKLAGTKLGNFGAFFKREWRQNDILWGRLDGAERIIKTLLDDSPERDELLLKAWLTILKESPFEDHWKKISGMLGEAVIATIEKTGELPAYDPAKQQEPNHPKNMIGRLQKYFIDHPLVDFEFSRDIAAKSLGRSLEVAGGVLDGMVEQYKGLETPALWLARIGQIVLGVLQVAIPDSLPRWFFRHWIMVAYVFEIFLIGAGLLLDSTGAIVRFGVTTLLLTIGVDFTVRLVEKYITGWTPTKRLIRGLVGVVVGVALVTAILLIYLGLVFLGVFPAPAFLAG